VAVPADWKQKWYTTNEEIIRANTGQSQKRTKRIQTIKLVKKIMIITQVKMNIISKISSSSRSSK
jgi:hypothetical protein